MLVIRQGCLASGGRASRLLGDNGFELYRGGKLGLVGAHSIEQDPEQQLRVQPREDGVTAVVGQPVKAAQ